MVKTKSLACGCCGEGFQTWEGYIDQDQDRGYGICWSCQSGIADTEKAEMDKFITLLMSALSPERKEVFADMDRVIQEYMVHEALKGGVLTYGKVGS